MKILLVAVGLLVATLGVAIYEDFIGYQHRLRVGFGKSGAPHTSTEVQVLVEQLAVPRGAVEGSATVYFGPSIVQEGATIGDDGIVRFRLPSSLMPPDPVALDRFEYPKSVRLSLDGGHSEAQIPLTREPGTTRVQGTGKFVWKARPVRSVIWYPFDSYELRLFAETGFSYSRADQWEPARSDQPALFRDAPLMHPTDSVELILVSPALLMTQSRVEAPQNPWGYTTAWSVTLSRPSILRVVSFVLLLVSLLAFFYLAIERDESKRLVYVLGFFGTLWAVRSVLLTGVTVFPVAVDYIVLLLYISAVFMVMSRYLLGRLRVKESESFDDRHG